MSAEAATASLADSGPWAAHSYLVGDDDEDHDDKDEDKDADTGDNDDDAESKMVGGGEAVPPP